MNIAYQNKNINDNIHSLDDMVFLRKSHTCNHQKCHLYPVNEYETLVYAIRYSEIPHDMLQVNWRWSNPTAYISSIFFLAKWIPKKKFRVHPNFIWPAHVYFKYPFQIPNYLNQPQWESLQCSYLGMIRQTHVVYGLWYCYFNTIDNKVTVHESITGLSLLWNYPLSS